MLLNAFKREVVLFWLLLSIIGSLALARVDNNWSRRPNNTVAQHHGGQAGYRPAVNGGYQQNLPTQWNRPNQTYAQILNNRTQYPQPNNYRPGMPTPVQNTRPQQSVYGQGGIYNQSRPTWQQPAGPSSPPRPVYNPVPNNQFNQARPSWQQPTGPSYLPRPVFNQTRPNTYYYAPPSPPQSPVYNPVANNNFQYNQTRPSWQQPPGPSNPPPRPVYNQTRPNTNYYPPQYPVQYPSQNPQTFPSQQPGNYPQNSVNFTRPLPSAPLLPNPGNNPAVPSGPSNLYPKLPSVNFPQPAPVNGNNGVPLAPLQPAPQNPQSPQNWQAGGQAALSYGPGHYPSPAGQPNKNPPNYQGSSNPYANMFI